MIDDFMLSVLQITNKISVLKELVVMFVPTDSAMHVQGYENSKFSNNDFVGEE